MTSQDHVGQQWLTSTQAARYLDLPSAAAVRMLVHRGTLRASGRAGRRLLFTAADLDSHGWVDAYGRST